MTMSGSILDLAALAERIKKHPAPSGRAVIAIDGPGASGKSTLAGHLSDLLPRSQVVHVDDFYLPSVERGSRLGEIGQLFDLPRLARQVVGPVTDSGLASRYQRYDWNIDVLADWIEIPAEADVIVEGVYSFETTLRPFYSFSIFCRTDSDTRLARGVLRDGEEARSMWTDVWMPAEEAYIAEQRPDLAADLLLDGKGDGGPDPVFRVVRE